MPAALTIPPPKKLRRKGPAKSVKPGDAEEMLLAELAARRARLAELLRLIRLEVTREMGTQRRTRGCRPVAPGGPAARVK
ncbi:MAG TPA: hypothetical protein VMH28_22690 [Candidatus Acidoferrales bacterium]|nr:hypothetical protein [Candidatus Acidoferrales bacterium]